MTIRKVEWLSVRVLLYSMLQEDKEIGYVCSWRRFASVCEAVRRG